MKLFYIYVVIPYFCGAIAMNMKKIFTYFLLTLFAASCTTEPIDSVREDDKIEVSIGQTVKIKSRTTIAEDGYSARWSKGDQLALWAVDDSGNFEINGETFKLMHFSEQWNNAIFTGFITPLTGSNYTYYATYPVPNSVSGTTATFSLPAVQDGSNAMGVRDIMVATPFYASALAEGVVTELDMRFIHKMHAMRIVLPENTIDGLPITKIEMTFSTNVVGDVMVNISDPDAGTTLLNGSKTLNINVPADYEGGDYLWAMIHPTALSGDITYRVFSGDVASKFKVISLTKEAKPSHISPMDLPMPEPNRFTTIIIDITENNLGEEFNTLTILDKNGNKVGSFTPSPDNQYKLVINGDINEADYKDQTFTFRYESEHAIVEDKVVFNNFTAYKTNNYTSKVPYLLFEDFSGIFTEKAKDGDNNYASSDTSQTGESLDSIMDPDGWNAARYWAKPGTCVRINTRVQTVKIFVAFSSSHHGRLDTPPLKGLKSGANVKLKVQFDAGAYKHKSSSATVNSMHISLATHTNAASAINGIPTGAKGLGSNYDTTIADFGTTYYQSKDLGNNFGENAFGSTFPTQTADVSTATQATRLCFYPTINSVESGMASNAECNVYIDNIRVSIAK